MQVPEGVPAAEEGPEHLEGVHRAEGEVAVEAGVVVVVMVEVMVLLLLLPPPGLAA